MPSIFKTGLIAAFAAVASAQSFSNYTAPTAVSVPGWVYNGCASSINAGKDFSFPGFTLVETSSTAMTVERCVADCSAYAFAAVSSGSCYCANTANGTAPVAETNCRARCPGNPAEACGGIAGTNPSKRQIVGYPFYSVYKNVGVIPAGTTVNIVITNIFIDVCSTGYFTATCVSTATVLGCGCSTQSIPLIPVTTTTVLCTACPTPGVVTVTVPAGITAGSATAATVTVTGTPAPPASTAPVVVATPAPPATTTKPVVFTGAAVANSASAGGLLSLLLAAVALF